MEAPKTKTHLETNISWQQEITKQINDGNYQQGLDS